MLAGVVSDTHNNVRNIKNLINIFNNEKVDLVIHTGDITSASSLNLFKSLKNYDEATGAWKNSRSLTLHQKDDLGGEIPNPNVLQEKIEKAKKLIKQSF